MKFHRKILSFDNYLLFYRKLCKSVNLTDSVFFGLKLHNKSNIWNLSDWSSDVCSSDLNRYEETVFSRVIYHMYRLCIWNFIEKYWILIIIFYWVLIIICYFTRKLYKFVNLTDSVFVSYKFHNKSNTWNLSDWNNFLES